MQPPPLKSKFFEFKDLISRPWQAWFNIVGKSGYVDRGDPSGWDFELGVLTTDATWNDLDLSGIVPGGATIVLLTVNIKDDTAGSRIMFRENGNSNAYNISPLNTQEANYRLYGDCWVKPDKNRIIEYNAEDVTWTSIEILVRGWFI